jgi:hypothetical protein
VRDSEKLALEEFASHHLGPPESSLILVGQYWLTHGIYNHLFPFQLQLTLSELATIGMDCVA